MLAKAAGVPRVHSGDDDLGPYSFFDLTVTDKDDVEQHVRFAAHDGDSMVHVLAERIDKVSDLAAALVHAGVTSQSGLSISTDQTGAPLRDEKEIRDHISAISDASSAKVPEAKKKAAGRKRSERIGLLIDSYRLKKAKRVREDGRAEPIKMLSRRSILPQFVGLTFSVYNGRKHVPIAVSEDMVGHKFSEFTMLPAKHAGRKKAAKSVK